MNYEVVLINSLLESGDLASCVEQGASKVFTEYKDVWNFICEFHKEYGSTPSKDVVKKEFKSFEFVKAESPLQYYIDDAKKQALNKGVRSALFHASDAMKNGEDPMKVLSIIQGEATDLLRDSGRMRDTNMADWRDRAKTLKERIDNPGEILGVPTGITVIDSIFGGLQPGDFIPVIGWTSSGKTWLTRLFAANAWRAGYRPLIISMEMDPLQEQYRFDTILNHGEVFTNQQLMQGQDIKFDTYEQWAAKTFDGKHPIHLVTADGVESPDQHFVQAKIDQYKPDFVILDGHALFDDARGGTEVEKTKNLSKAFKRIAVSNHIPVIDVCMVTMEDGKHDERPPLLSEIAWSRQLSFDADLVLAIYRPPGSSFFTVVARKTRRCPPFAFYLEWDLNTGKWKEVYDAPEID